MDSQRQDPILKASLFALQVVLSEGLDLAAIRNLFHEYASWLSSQSIDLAFQSYTSEFSSLPGKYSQEKGGCLLLARSNDVHQTPLGCVALRPLEPPAVAEMKRLWVTPQARSLSLGRHLVSAVLEKAKVLGYDEVKLDTLPFMEKARRMYETFGFRECDPYYDSPIRDTVFLSCKIATDERIVEA